MNFSTILFMLFTLSAIRCEINAPVIPTVESFLEWLFNKTITEVIDIAKAFKFEEVTEENIKFLYYGENNTNNSIELNHKNLAKLIDPEKTTKLIIHGWQSSGSADFVKDMAENYHKIGKYNVIGVDWSKYSSKEYLLATRSVKSVGNHVANFLCILINRNLITSLDAVHLIGHSLGAHVSGFAGQYIQQKTNNTGKIKRITGLDAAGPLFEIPLKRPVEYRLSEDDAHYVDVIHTDKGFLGFLGSIGVSDFFINSGGPIQPGCLNILNIFSSFTCSHSKSHSYYRDSIINMEKYNSTSCSNDVLYRTHICDKNRKTVMGEHVSLNANGNFYLETSNSTSNLNLLRKIIP